MLYLITYDLNKPGQEYDKLYETIKDMGPWWHHLDSTWLVDTDLGTSDIRDRVKAVIDSNDHVLVVKFGSNWASFNSKRANEWIHKHTSS